MKRSASEIRQRGLRLGRSLADAVGRRIVASARRLQRNVQRVAFGVGALPHEITASPHAIAAGLVATTMHLAPVPGGPAVARVLDRAALRIVRAIALHRASRIRACLGALASSALVQRSSSMAEPPARWHRRAVWSRLAADARVYAVESLPVAGPCLRVVDAASAGIDAWTIVLIADIQARQEVAA